MKPVPRRRRTDGETRARPRDLVGQLSVPLRDFLATEAGGAALLLVASVVALGWANSPWSDSYEALWATEAGLRVGGFELSMDLEHWVNDALMALFFFVVGLEVRRELSIGELTERRRIAIPLLAGVGGLVVPALIYLAIAPGGEPAGAWGIVIGTDTAFLLGALAVVGPTYSTQLRIFLLTITVLDDIVAVSVIGLVYSGSIRPGPLVVMVLLGAAMAALSRIRVWRIGPYAVLAVALWIATFEAGLHASIAGMLGGLLVAADVPRWDAVEGAAARFRAFSQSPLVQVGRSARRGLQQSISVNERMGPGRGPRLGQLPSRGGLAGRGRRRSAAVPGP